jgi:hypothetical protein
MNGVPGSPERPRFGHGARTYSGVCPAGQAVSRIAQAVDQTGWMTGQILDFAGGCNAF